VRIQATEDETMTVERNDAISGTADQPMSLERLARQLQDLPLSAWAGRYPFINASGVLEPALTIAVAALSRSVVGQALLPQSAAEAAAQQVPADYAQPVGVLERYGLVGDGATDDTAAFHKAIAVSAQGVQLLGTPGKTYMLAAEVAPGAYFDVDLRGATLKFSGNHIGFNTELSRSITVNIASSIAQGSRQCTVVSTAGLAIGHWTYVSCNDAPTNPIESYPPSWARITGIAGRTVTFDRAFQVAYPAGAATLSLTAVADAAMKPLCRVKNGRIDGSANTYSGAALGCALRLVGYKVVDIDVELVDWNTTSTNGQLAIAFLCHTVNWKLTAIGNVSGSQISNSLDCMSVKYIGCTVDSDGFGIAMTRCDSAIAQGNTLVGRRKQNSDDSVPVRSVRGIKAYGCGHAVIGGNELCDYESPIKVEGCHRYVVNGNIITNAGLEGRYTGAIAINIGAATDGNFCGYGIVSNNIVENGGGIGIGITASSMVGRNVVTGNALKSLQGTAIHSGCHNTIITDNQIADWGLRDAGDPAIHHDAGATIIGNRFYHATLKGLPCIRNSLVAGSRYVVCHNAPQDGNPLGLVMENSGSATIPNGSTSVVVTHGLSRAPLPSEISLTMQGTAANDPGSLYLSAIDGTHFTINSRADPGASGLSVAWRVSHPLPA
jgi:hypothetical protein